ncbi:hypothetical protein [Scytonema sp. NUACC21]
MSKARLFSDEPDLVGWGATKSAVNLEKVGGFPELSEVAFEEQNPTNQFL